MKFRLLSISLLCLPLLSWSHGGGHPTRYVSASGTDSGECEKPETACASIEYTVNKSSKGDQILVAEGLYIVDEVEVFYLLSNMVQMTGGYSTSNQFKQQDSERYATKIQGIAHTYRDALAERGFQLVQDQKGQELGLRTNEKTWLKQYSKLTTVASSSEGCNNGKSGVNDCHNIDKLSHIPLSQFSSKPTGANDIWGFVDLNNQREYALIGLNNGTAIMDVSTPENPVEVGFIAGESSTWRDIKVLQRFDDTSQRYHAWAYVTTEANQGLQIIDLSDLPNSVNLAVTDHDTFVSAHNVYIANVDYSSGLAIPGMQPYLYILGANTNGGRFMAYSLDNPLKPVLLTTGSRGYVHDGTSLFIDDERIASCPSGLSPCELFIDFNETSVDIWDVSDKSQNHLISATSYQELGYVHSGWWSSDKKTLFVQDELDERDRGLNTTLRALDISDLSKPTLGGCYQGPTQAIDHNGFSKANYYYMSNYRRALAVLDVSDISAIKEVGFF